MFYELERLKGYFFFFSYILIKPFSFFNISFFFIRETCVCSTATDGKSKCKPQPIRVHQESDLRFPRWNITTLAVPSNQSETSKLPSDKYFSYIKIYKITSDSLREKKLHYNHLGKKPHWATNKIFSQIFGTFPQGLSRQLSVFIH